MGVTKHQLFGPSSVVFWNLTLRRFLSGNRRFERTCRLRLRRLLRVEDRFFGNVGDLIPKRRRVTSHKTSILDYTSVKTSNLICHLF
jgi:hypothetical protein